MIKRLFLIALLAAFASAATMPTLGKVLGFSSTAAYAQDEGNNDQGEDLDDNGQ
jgi:hypothetical protein